MDLQVDREDVWVATIEDKPGGLSEKLKALAEGGAALEFVIARRSPDKPGQGVVFVTPLEGVKALAAAENAGFRKTEHLRSIRVEGPDKPGLGAEMTLALAEKGINLRGLSAAVIGTRFVAHFALDSDEDAITAAKVLRGL